MNEVIALRLEHSFLEKLDKLSKEEEMDRSTIVRKLMKRGFAELMKERASDDYKSGKITLSLAASRAELSIFDMMQYLVSQGYTSPYSIEDLEEDIKLLEKLPKNR